MARDGEDKVRVEADWLSSRTAGDRLGLSSGQIRYLIRQGRLVGGVIDGKVRVEPDSVETLAAERQRWISTVEAGKLAGCSAPLIADAAQRGEIVQRRVHRSLPSVERTSVLAWAETRRQVLAERERRRRHLEEQRALEGRPDFDHQWLTLDQAAHILGCSRRWVSSLASQDRLPYTVVGQRRWFRADHLHRWVRARALEERFGQSAAW